MRKAILSIVAAALLFSTMEIALKLFSLGFNPLQLNLIRFTLGALLLLPAALKSLRRLQLDYRDLGFFALGGFICVVVSMTLYQVAVTRTPASVVAILFSCNPIFVVPLAALMLRERILPRTILALLACLLGIAFILEPALGGAGAGGIGLTLLSALTFALYGVLGKARSARFGSAALTCLSFTAGSLELLILILLSRLGPVAHWLRGLGLSAFAGIPVFRGLTPASLPGLLYLGICVTGLGYLFYFRAMEASSASTASIVFFIKPALAPLLALLVLGENLNPSKIGGIVCIVLGSAVALLKKRTATDTQPGGGA